jgi:hypothetical protein
MKRWLVLTAILGACSNEPEVVREPTKTLSATLDLEIRDRAEVVLETTGERLRAKLTLTSGFGVAPAGELVSGDGFVEAFPEADATLYTARFSLPPAAGPCGAEPVSLALSLHRSGKNTRVAGSLTAYCGADRWHGVPARTPLRLSGTLPLPAD